MSQEWIVRASKQKACDLLAARFDLHPAAALLLVNRGIETEDAAADFLNPSLSDIPDPFSLKDMGAAAKRIASAIGRREKIAIFGDYDADGVTGAALLASFIGKLGIEPEVDLPHRLAHGYGLSIPAVEEFKAKGVELIITVDNGMRAVAEIERARALGIDVIVTDHHAAEGALPQAVAVVNPKREDTPKALENLAGCGVAFMLALAVRKILRDERFFGGGEQNLKNLLDLVALGTVADAVPLTGANRIFVKFGLAEIALQNRVGIKALLEASGTKPKTLKPHTLAFQLAPRINAAGRLGSAFKALELLTCTDSPNAEKIARELNQANTERQRIEDRMLEDAVAMIETDPKIPGNSSLVLAREGWHVGVIGITAARLAQRFSCPAVVFSKDQEPARGSARAFSGPNLVEALESCRDSIVKFGGHAMAAGLSVEAANLVEFARKFDETCMKLSPQTKVDSLLVDAFVNAADINSKLIDDIALLEPFGTGNPEPIFAIRNINVMDARIVGTDHLRLKLGTGNTVFDAIGFGMAKKMPAKGVSVGAAFTPEFNEWNGFINIQLRLKDIREA